MFKNTFLKLWKENIFKWLAKTFVKKIKNQMVEMDSKRHLAYAEVMGEYVDFCLQNKLKGVFNYFDENKNHGTFPNPLTKSP